METGSARSHACPGSPRASPVIATLCAASLLAACGDRADTLASCPADTTPIHVIQGTDWASPLLGEVRGVTGVVTLVRPDGIYIESLAPDSDDRTSEGLFLRTAGLPTGSLHAGTVVTTQGRVAELGDDG